MATGGIPATRENLYYMGAGKQSAWNTPVAPTWYWRWLDGADANPERKITSERVGDMSPYISIMYPVGSWWVIKVVEYAWPQTIGYALQALLGTGSDTYTAPTKSTTLANSIASGDTDFDSTADLGSSGTLAINFTPGYTSTTYEVQTVDLSTKTGTGPYTYTLDGGATFKNAHSNGDAITSASTHTMKRSLTTFDPYSVEAAFAQSGFGVAMRMVDAVCGDLTITSEMGKLIRFEHTWYARQAAIQAALQSPTYEGNSVVGVAGGPLHHYMGAANWRVDGSASAPANYIRKAVIRLKNGTTPDELQSEGMTPDGFLPGNFDIDGELEVIWTTYAQYYETYFGSSAPAAGTTDSTLQGFGSFAAGWASDAINQLALSLPNVGYTAAKLPPPKLDGKPANQQVMFSGVASQTQPVPFTATLTNSANAQY